MKNNTLIKSIILCLVFTISAWADLVNVYEDNKYDLYDTWGRPLVEEHLLIWELSQLSGRGLVYNGMDPTTTVYKTKYPFGNFFQGFISFVDTLVLDIKLEYILADRRKRTYFTDYTLKNNFIDGMHLKIGRQNWLKFETLMSRLSYGPAQLAQNALWENGDRIQIGTDTPQVENDLLYAFNIDLNPQNFNRAVVNRWGYDIKDWFDLQNLRLTYVNMHHRNTDENTRFTRGRVNREHLRSIGTNYSVYVRISPIAPELSGERASYYSFSANDQTGTSLPFSTLSVLPASASDSDGETVYNLTGNNEIILRVDIPITSGENRSRELNLNLRLANGFLVQVSETGEFYDYDPNNDGAMADNSGLRHHLPADAVLYSRQGINDYANKDDYRYIWGYETAVNIIGLGYRLRLGPVYLKGDLNWIVRYNQYPDHGEEGNYSKTVSTAGDLFLGFKWDKGIDIKSKNNFYYADPEYKAFFNTTADSDGGKQVYYAVTENDNDNFYTPLFSTENPQEIFETLPGLDRNNNGVDDYLEPFVLFSTMPVFFREADDLNNNNVADDIEDDQRLDYTHDTGLLGIKSDTTVKPLSGLSLRYLFINEWRAYTRPDKANLIHSASVIADKKLDKLYGRVNFEYRFVKDDIRNNAAPNPYTTVTILNRGVDERLYAKSHVFNPMLIAGIRELGGFDMEMRLRSQVNHQLPDTHNQIQLNEEKRNLIHDGMVVDMSYTWRLRLLGKRLIPRLAAKYQREREYITGNRLNLEGQKKYSLLAAGPMVEYKMGSISTLLMGYQYSEYRDQVDKDNSYRGNDAGFEINFGSMGQMDEGRHITLSSGMMFIHREFMNLEKKKRRVGSYFFAKIAYNY